MRTPTSVSIMLSGDRGPGVNLAGAGRDRWRSGPGSDGVGGRSSDRPNATDKGFDGNWGCRIALAVSSLHRFTRVPLARRRANRLETPRENRGGVGYYNLMIGERESGLDPL